MRIGARIPEQYVVVKGAGQSDFGPGISPYETASYDIALLDAGIDNFNIVKYTSVIPPQAKQISMEEAKKQNLFHHGMVLESIMAQVNGTHGEHLCAGVGTMKVYRESAAGNILIGGFAAEYEGHESETKADQVLRQALQQIYDRRYVGIYGDAADYFMADVETHTKDLVVDDKYGTVLVALGFLSFAVLEIKD